GLRGMLNDRNRSPAGYVLQATAPRRRPGAVYAAPAGRSRTNGRSQQGAHPHPLARGEENARLFNYERRIKSTFDAIVPTLKRVSALQHEEQFELHAQNLARERLGFELPAQILADAWVEQLDMRRLYAWCVFET